MRYLRLFGLLGVCLLTACYAHAQRVVVGVGIGAPAYYGPTPVCIYGYYDYYPYACAPYGFYGPDWFAGGVFIGAGPWDNTYGHGYYRRRYGAYDRGGTYCPGGVSTQSAAPLCSAPPPAPRHPGRAIPA